VRTNRNAGDRHKPRPGMRRIRRTKSVWLAALLLVLLIPVAVAENWIYTVRPGDNLWNLSERHLTSMKYWRPLQQLNNIIDPLHIPPGTRLKFPLAWLKHQPASAEVTQLQGSAQLIRAADGKTQPLTVKTRLYSGDRIQTGPDANLSIRFADGSELLVLSDSEVVMDSLSAYGSTGMVDTRIRLPGGRVDTRVKPSKGPGSRYQIITPAAVAAVRGTGFRVSSDPEKPVARSEVMQGEVGVSGAGVDQVVPAGFGIVAEAGQPLQPPRKLLPAPDLSAVPAVLERLPLRFAWPGVAGAVHYRFQIAPDTRFDRLLADAVTVAAEASWPDLPDGEYQLRVRAIDQDRLEGLNAVHAFSVDARPPPPRLIGLIDGVLTRQARPEFSWSQPAGTTAYHFQLARDAAFRDLLAERGDLREARFQPEQALPPGRYYWRVATHDGSGRPGPFSDAQAFHFRPVPPAPDPAAPQIGKQDVSFPWQAVEGAARYHFQLAQDPDFNEIIVDQTLAEPRLTMPRPPGRKYYFRARSLDTDGEAGPYSSPQAVTVPPASYWPLLLLVIPLLL